MIRNLWNRWLSYFKDINSAQAREFALAAFIVPISGIVHFSYIFIFGSWGVMPLALFNIFSVLIYVGVGIIFLRLNKRRIGTFLLVTEGIIHSFLAVHYLGWEFGAQYFPFISLVYVSFGWATFSRKERVGFAVSLFIIFLFFYYYSLSFPPLYTVPAVSANHHQCSQYCVCIYSHRFWCHVRSLSSTAG